MTPLFLAAADDIRDIRGVIAIPSSLLWLYWAGGLLAAALAAWGAAVWLRSRKKPAAPPDALTIALGELEKARALLAPETAREFSIAVSAAVRAYIEARFADRAAHQTTEEFLHGLLSRSGSPLGPYRERLGDFLGHCDRAKFGRWSLRTEEMESMWQSAHDFLLETRPQPELVQVPIPAAAP